MPEYEFKEPLRLRIKKALTAALSEISIAGGYKHDLKGKVFRGRVWFGDSDPIPLVGILEVPVQPDDLPVAPDNPNRRSDWDLTIQGFVDDDYENPSDPAEYLVADVIRRLAVEKKKNADFDLFGMGDDIVDLRIGIPVVRPSDELSAKAYFWLPITLELAENLEEPYGKVVKP